MTKGELFKLLEGFSDDVEVRLLDAGDQYMQGHLTMHGFTYTEGDEEDGEAPLIVLT